MKKIGLFTVSLLLVCVFANSGFTSGGDEYPFKKEVKQIVGKWVSEDGAAYPSLEFFQDPDPLDRWFVRKGRLQVNAKVGGEVGYDYYSSQKVHKLMKTYPANPKTGFSLHQAIADMVYKPGGSGKPDRLIIKGDYADTEDGVRTELNFTLVRAGSAPAPAAKPAAKPATADGEFSAAALKLMSTFLSNFSEQGVYSKPASPDDMILFGIRHNYINNFKSRVAQCKVKDCPYGALTIKTDHVFETIKKYLNDDLGSQFKEGQINYTYADGDGYYYDKKAGLFHFDGPKEDKVYYARVTEARTVKQEIAAKGAPAAYVEMKGYFYNVKNEKDRNGTFTAYGAPYKYGGKDTWYLMQLTRAGD